MRRSDRAITNPTTIHHWLDQSTICRVAFSGDPYPYIVPMNYGHKDGVLYFHCALEGRKLDFIKENPFVGFEIEHQHKLVTGAKACAWTTHYQSLVGEGRIEILHSPEEKRKALDILMQQFGKQDNTYPEHTLAKMHALKLTIHGISGKQAGEW